MFCLLSCVLVMGACSHLKFTELHLFRACTLSRMCYTLKNSSKNEPIYKNNHNFKMETTEAKPDQQCEWLWCGGCQCKTIRRRGSKHNGLQSRVPQAAGRGSG